MIKLPNVTLCIADTHYYGEAISSLKKSLTKIEPAATKFLTDIKAYNPKFPFEIVKIDKLDGKKGYSEFMIKELDKYFDTDFVLVTQHDAWVLDEKAWTDEFLEYDYVGAGWLEVDGYNVGNGGFSLRSKRLQHILATDEFIHPFHPEDATICRLYRPYLEEKHGIKFAPDALADKFSFELREPIQSTFGFHGKFHKPYQQTIVVKRDGAGGDIVMCEPVLEYFYNKGYKVVLDAPLHLALLFASHHYQIFHISQLTDNRVKPIVIDLNMAYENKPKQNHLKSYYEAAGIEDGAAKAPRLNFKIGDHNRLFKNYIVIHIDKRQEYRNINNVNWREVVTILNNKGYNVIQVGLTDHEEIVGAIQFNTATTNMLLYLIAGAQAFIGVDSLPSHIAVATGIRAIIFFGSVSAEMIHPDLSNICVIETGDVCGNYKCWHNSINVSGEECVINKELPPCSIFDTSVVVKKITDFL